MLRLRPIAALLFALAPASFTFAEEAKFEITVEAGEHDRQGTPIRVALPVAKMRHAVVRGEDGIAAQLSAPGLQAAAQSNPTQTLHFVLPSLKAGATATFQVELTDATPDPVKGYAWTDKEGEYSELAFDTPSLRYMYHQLDESSKESREQTYKPFHHVYSPDGATIITKGPGGKYTHHRGLYFGFNKVSYGDDFAKKCDVWHCNGKAYQEHEAFLSQDVGPVLGRHKVQIGWHGAAGEKFAEEQRELSVYNAPVGQLIEFASVVKTTDGPIKLDGDPQHAGFHFRAHNDVNDKTAKQTYYLRTDGKGEPGATRNWSPGKTDPTTVNEPWKVCSFVLDGKRYSVLRVEHPENPGEKRTSERDYGRFGGYFEYTITPEQPLKVRYRVVVKDGEFTQDEAARLAADFASPPKVTVTKK